MSPTVGISVDRQRHDVARFSCHIILLEPSLAAISQALLRGGGTFANTSSTSHGHQLELRQHLSMAGAAALLPFLPVAWPDSPQ